MLQALARRHNMVIVSPILVRTCIGTHLCRALSVRRMLQALARHGNTMICQPHSGAHLLYTHEKAVLSLSGATAGARAPQQDRHCQPDPGVRLRWVHMSFLRCAYLGSDHVLAAGACAGATQCLSSTSMLHCCFQSCITFSHHLCSVTVAKVASFCKDASS